MQDWRLLREYVDGGSQAAFAKLVERHLRPVYATCLREVRDPNLAEDVTQAVFIVLAKRAPAIRAWTPLAGWLFNTSRLVAKNARRREARRAAIERKAAEEMQSSDLVNDPIWREIDPVLNDAVASLRAPEREIILLRFYHELSMAETGASLGISEDAAKMRIGRALDKLRRALAKSGVVVPALGFAALFTAHAAQAVPAAGVLSMTAALSTIAAGGIGQFGAGVTTMTEGAIKAMWIAKLKAVAAIIVMCLVGGGAVALVGHSRGAAAVMPIKMPAMGSPEVAAPETRAGTAVLAGKLTFEDGKPAAGFKVAAQLQNNSIEKLFSGLKSDPTTVGTQRIVYPKRLSLMTWAEDITKADGSFRLTGLTDLPYNIAVFDYSDHPGPPTKQVDAGTDRWVAAAVEGVTGNEGGMVTIPNLVLTSGSFIIGMVIDKATGTPMSNTSVGCYGPERPDSTAMCNMTRTDSAGHYRLRVAPGKHRVYAADGPQIVQVTVDVAKGETKTVDIEAVPTRKN